MQILFTLNFNLQEDLKCLKTNDNEKRNFPADFSVYTENLFLLSIAMGYNANPLYNYSSYSIFQEPDNSIDVLPSETAMYTAAFSLSYGGNNRDLPDIPGDSQASVSRKLTNI